MDTSQYLIDELCRLSGFSRRTVRYYVQEGLVDPPAGRGRGGYYSDVQLGQLARIRELQEQGYRLEAIKGLRAAPQPMTPEAPAAPHSPWTAYSQTRYPFTRIVLAPGVELQVSAEAEAKLGPAIATALQVLRSVFDHEGGSNA